MPVQGNRGRYKSFRLSRLLVLLASQSGRTRRHLCGVRQTTRKTAHLNTTRGGVDVVTGGPAHLGHIADMSHTIFGRSERRP